MVLNKNAKWWSILISIILEYIDRNIYELPENSINSLNIAINDWIAIEDTSISLRFGKVFDIENFDKTIDKRIYRVFIEEENKIINCYSFAIIAHISIDPYNKLLEDIRKKQISKDMIKVTNMIICKKTNKIIKWV